MAVELIKLPQRFQGLSTDAKPTDSTIQNGAQFLELDTGNTFQYDTTGPLWRLLSSGQVSGTNAVPTLLRQALSVALETLAELRRLRMGLVLGAPMSENSICADIDTDVLSPLTIIED